MIFKYVKPEWSKELQEAAAEPWKIAKDGWLFALQLYDSFDSWDISFCEIIEQIKIEYVFFTLTQTVLYHHCLQTYQMVNLHL